MCLETQQLQEDGTCLDVEGQCAAVAATDAPPADGEVPADGVVADGEAPADGEVPVDGEVPAETLGLLA